MKSILLTSLLFSGVECSTETIVYTCNSPNATRYHYKENCRGLSGCQYQIKKTTLENAKKENKILCKWEESYRD